MPASIFEIVNCLLLNCLCARLFSKSARANNRPLSLAHTSARAKTPQTYLGADMSSLHTSVSQIFCCAPKVRCFFLCRESARKRGRRRELECGERALEARPTRQGDKHKRKGVRIAWKSCCSVGWLPLNSRSHACSQNSPRGKHRSCHLAP